MALEHYSHDTLVPDLDASMSLILRKNEVQHPGSRGGHWYYDKQGQIQYGDPPSGNTGMHSGDYHQMFVQHFNDNPHQQNVIRDLHFDAGKNNWTPQQHAARALTQSSTLIDYSTKRARDQILQTGDKTPYHEGISKLGHLLDTVQEHGTRLGFDKDPEFKNAYNSARIKHARHMIDSGQHKLTMPTQEELRNVEPFKNHGDLRDWASQYLPQVEFEIDSMDIAAADAMVYQLVATASQHDPAIAAKLRYIGTRENEQFKDWRNAYAHASRDGQIIGLNPAHMKNYPELTQRVLADHKSGWGKAMNPNHIITHEYGHMVDFHYSNNPQWDTLVMDWKRAHQDETEFPPVSGYAAHDDAKRYTERKREMPDRTEQWPESFVEMTHHQFSQQSQYAIHHKRLLDFIKDNPNIETTRDEFDPQELAQMGITDPLYVRVSRRHE